MNFYIRQNSTLPILKFPLTQRLMEKYDITDDMMENVGVTFSMITAEDGRYRIANTEARLIIKKDRVNYPDEVDYTIAYDFKLSDTKKAGHFFGEFVLDFLGDHCGKIKFPVNHDIDIYIQESSTKTSVV